MNSSIKKYKNGNVVLKLDLTKDSHYMEDGEVDIDAYYNREMTMQDLYFNIINGYMYLLDNNTMRLYDFSSCYINILVYLKDQLIKEKGKLKLYPLSKKETKDLLQDLNNGY